MKLNGFRSQCQITGQHPAKGAMRQDKVVPLRRMNEALRPGPLLFAEPGLAPLEYRRFVYEGKAPHINGLIIEHNSGDLRRRCWRVNGREGQHSL